MTSCKVYLTKSVEVARLIAKAHTIGADNVVRISFGSADEQDVVPKIYCGSGYFFCTIVRESDLSGYEIVFA